MIYKAHLKLVDGVIVVRTFINEVGEVNWYRVAAGHYQAELPEAFGESRIFLANNVLDIDLEGKTQALFSIAAADKLEIGCQNEQGDHIDWLNFFVEFEVFPTSYLS